MDEAKFDQLLKIAAARRVPSLPGSFAQDVLREIRVRKSEAPQHSWLQEIGGLFLRPGLLAGSLAVALAVGVALPAAVAKPANSSGAVSGLGLAVFSSSSVNMPSGLLAKAP